MACLLVVFECLYKTVKDLPILTICFSRKNLFELVLTFKFISSQSLNFLFAEDFLNSMISDRPSEFVLNHFYIRKK